MGYQEENVCEDSEPISKKRRSSTSEKDSPCEVWFHGYCVVWSPGFYTVDNTLVGCEQVVIDARTRFCSVCGENGATLICLQRTCRKLFHFYCAKEYGCVFDESNYTIQCGKHVK
ncbi:retinoic acid-induced protein 1-like isoform X2 [Xenia sp. Carnegie-2017]|uniref:retinoic acid-induced protein 1-like isoform X2 n=1 Tax=Xenia sp. Carnegie-2017 TaxID=2897299 RepID=UPI001F042661|nr:retinoic acid-induced protein 1-like isoform X2 [Xenia sp. Carnegie-2017]